MVLSQLPASAVILRHLIQNGLPLSFRGELERFKERTTATVPEVNSGVDQREIQTHEGMLNQGDHCSASYSAMLESPTQPESYLSLSLWTIDVE